MDPIDLADLHEGVRLFNEGKFWHAHEAWEQVWRRKKGCCDDFFKGMIQAAAAFHKMGEGAVKGMRIHLDRSITRLTFCPPAFLGIDVAAFVRELERCRNEIEWKELPVQEAPKVNRST
ncbi:MAG: DUF309 domain-containing protein [Opitutales bacterium]